MFKNLVLGGGVIAMLMAVLIFSGRLPIGIGKTTKPTGEVVVWGTLPSDTIEPIFQDYNIKAETYRISYKQIDETIFVSRLVDALANGNGPDMILAPYQIILSQTSRLYPFPLTSLSEKSFKDNYVDGASIFWSPYGALALPLNVDPLVLFYNRTLLSKHGVVNPPSYWNDVVDVTQKLTIEGARGTFVESAISLGAYNNIPYVKEILVAIVNQLGQTPVLQSWGSNGLSYQVFIDNRVSENSEVKPLTAAVRFFTQFSDPSKVTFTWNKNSPNAPDAFVAERLAMYIGYSGESQRLHEANQKADIAMTYFPQTKGYNTFVTGMRMYGLATLRQTKNPQASLSAEAGLSSGQWVSIIANRIGGVPPVKQIISSDPNIPEVIARSALVARGWPDIYYGSTNLLFERMIEDILSGRQLVVDATESFVGRFTNLYTGIK